MTLRSVGAGLCVAILVSAGEKSLYAADYYGALKDYFKRTFRGEPIVPTPYGADARFAPKRMWIYTEDAINKVDGTGTRKGWIPLMDGRTIYNDQLVPLYSDPVTLPVSSEERHVKWGIALSLLGKLGGDTGTAELGTDWDRGLEVSIDMGSAEVYQGDYYQFLLAQQLNRTLIDNMNNILLERFNNKMPDRRLIIGALRVKGAKISVSQTAKTTATLGGNVVSWLSKLGLSWDSQKKATDTLTLDDWRYVGVTMLKMNESGLVGSTAEAPDDLRTFSARWEGIRNK